MSTHVFAKVSFAYAGVTLRLKDDLKIGSSFDSFGNGQYFNGKLDDVSQFR
jgi:hypothetical protein